MWILRFHLLKPKDYNKVQRICEKYGFISRSHSPTLYAKAIVKHSTQKTSWRALSREFHIDHAGLSRFYDKAKNTGLLSEIFHIFSERRVCLYTADVSHISSRDLDNSQEIYQLTQGEIQNILRTL